MHSQGTNSCKFVRLTKHFILKFKNKNTQSWCRFQSRWTEKLHLKIFFFKFVKHLGVKISHDRQLLMISYAREKSRKFSNGHTKRNWVSHVIHTLSSVIYNYRNDSFHHWHRWLINYDYKISINTKKEKDIINLTWLFTLSWIHYGYIVSKDDVH